MKLVHGDEQERIATQSVRSGTLEKRYIFDGGEPGPGNFIFILAYQTGDFFSPRHHHNFDQWRLQLEGDCKFDKNGVMKPGTLGYFPEGAYYGPQSSDEPNVVGVVQFGGPSGNGFLDPNQLYGAHAALKEFGHFEKGVFFRKEGLPPTPGVTNRKTLDSFQASWEFANKRPMIYPKPQYVDPILMDGDNYRWMPVDDAPGVEEKAYGTFTDCAIRAGSFRLAPGATLAATGRGIYFVVSGAGTVDGNAYRAQSAVYLDSRESASFTATAASEIVLLGLPDVSRMRTPLPHDASVELEEVEA
jgi:hypothetical protein